MSLLNIEKNIVKKISYFKSWNEKYKYIINMGKNLPKMDKKFRTKEKLVQNCQSPIWLDAYLKNKKIFFIGDCDAIIPRGIISLMIYIYSNNYPNEIIKSKTFFIKKIGFKNFLSPSRSNGIIAILKKIKIYAFILLIKYNLR